MAEHDSRWYDEQYNNRARVRDHSRLLARWAEASALVRQQLSPKLDLAYGPTAAERLDLFPAAAGTAPAGGAPVLVFIHGGWWRALDKSDHSFIAPSFSQAGALVLLPNYGLCPTVGIEDIALQITRCLDWVWRHAAEHGGDPSRIFVAGHSAGGHLAAMMLACRWKDVAPDLPPRLVAGALSVSGVYDLEPLRLTTFLQPDLQLTPASVRRLSPAFFPRPRGPLYAMCGGSESEEFIRQNRLIRDQWGPTTVPICETVLGKHHFDVLHELIDPMTRSHALALRLLGLR